MSRRTAGNQRRYGRDVLRRVAFIRTSQRVGVPLAEIRAALATLPAGPPPRRTGRVSRGSGARTSTGGIERLLRLRDTLDSCIGCGSLSLRSCALHDTDDHLCEERSGARILTVE